MAKKHHFTGFFIDSFDNPLGNYSSISKIPIYLQFFNSIYV